MPYFGGGNSNSFLSVAAGLVAGVALIVWGGSMALDQVRLWRDGVKTTGTVVSFERSRSMRRRDSFFPVVQFRTRDGRTVTFKHRVGSSKPVYKRGARVLVIYPPDAPDEAVLGGVFWNWAIPAAMLLGGQAFFFFSLFKVPGLRLWLGGGR